MEAQSQALPMSRKFLPAGRGANLLGFRRGEGCSKSREVAEQQSSLARWEGKNPGQESVQAFPGGSPA